MLTALDLRTPRVEVMDGPLGRWVSAWWRPPALARHVSLLWFFDGALNLARERVFPDGTVELIVHLGPRYRSTLADEHRDGYPLLCFNGLRMKAEVIEAPPGRSRVVGLRLTPSGAGALLRGAHIEACDRTLDLQDVLGGSARALGDALDQAGSPHAVLRAAAAWLGSHLQQAPPEDPAVTWVCREIERRAGRASIAALCEHAGLSPTRLPARFRAQLGVTRKQWARIVRFKSTLARLAAPEPPPLVTLALDAGYADQAHFSTEFRQMAGMSPGAYLRALRYPNTASLAEAGD